MPKKGFKSITLKEDVYKRLEKVYNQNKLLLQREGVDSLSSFITRIISSYIKEGDTARLEHFNLHENVIRIKDKKLERIIDVDYRNGEMFCELCGSTDCVHTGYAWSIYQQYKTVPSTF
jgi:predicted CopG family antitoxin